LQMIHQAAAWQRAAAAAATCSRSQKV
jgi:hypothetical protein